VKALLCDNVLNERENLVKSYIKHLGKEKELNMLCFAGIFRSLLFYCTGRRGHLS
jgi:hypothetical protein